MNKSSMHQCFLTHTGTYAGTHVQTCNSPVAKAKQLQNTAAFCFTHCLSPVFFLFSQSDYLLATQRAERTKDVLSLRFACVYEGRREKEKAITAGFKTLKDELMELLTQSL